MADPRLDRFTDRPGIASGHAFAVRLAASCARALGDAVAGVVLHGSLTLGDYLPGRSDVDLLVIVEEPPTDPQLAALAETVAGERVRAPGRVDLRVVTRQVAAAPVPVPPMEMGIALHPDPDSDVHVETRHPGERDLVVEFSVCRAHSRSLAGAAPRELLGEVPVEWVLAVGAAQLSDWQALEYSPRHGDLMVLTTCRIWRFAEERRHCSKSAAGEWALRRDPTLEVIEAALRRRCGEAAAPIEEQPVRGLLSAVQARL